MNFGARGTWAIVVSFVVAFMLTAVPLPDWAVSWRPDWVALVLAYWCLALPRRIGVLTAWFIGLLLFDPCAQSQGYGASVVEAFCAHAWESGATRLRLAVGLNNDGARRFWVRNGFHFVRKAETVGEQSGVPVEVYERRRAGLPVMSALGVHQPG